MSMMTTLPSTPVSSKESITTPFDIFDDNQDSILTALFEGEESVQNPASVEYPLVFGSLNPSAILDIYGHVATDATPRYMFREQMDYEMYCDQGQQIRIHFGTTDEVTGVFTTDFTAFAPRKLLIDHSGFFAAMFAGPCPGFWDEARRGIVQFQSTEVDIVNFKRLQKLWAAGPTDALINIGLPAETFRNMVTLYRHADFFKSDMTMRVIKNQLRSYMTKLTVTWKSDYQMCVRLTGCHDAELRERLIDLAVAFRELVSLPPHLRPLEPEALATFTIVHAPKPLLRQVLNDLDTKFQVALIRATVNL